MNDELVTILHSLKCSAWVKDMRLPDYGPHAVEEWFLDSQDTDIMLNWCRQSGKTRSSSFKVAHKAKFMPNSVHLLISVTQRQAGILQRRVASALRDDAKSDWNQEGEFEVHEDPMDESSRMVKCSVLSLELANGAMVISAPASEDAIRGYTPDTIVLDEGSRIPDKVIDAIRPMRAAHPCQLIVPSTPNGKRGWYYKEWISDDPVWKKSLVTADMCPRISKEFLERERLKMSSEAMFRQEYYCEFIELKGALFTEEMINKMFIHDTESPADIVKPWPMDRLFVTDKSYRLEDHHPKE